MDSTNCGLLLGGTVPLLKSERQAYGSSVENFSREWQPKFKPLCQLLDNYLDKTELLQEDKSKHFRKEQKIRGERTCRKRQEIGV